MNPSAANKALPKRGRVEIACVSCRKRKSRVRYLAIVLPTNMGAANRILQCDGVRPSCGRCRGQNVICRYENLLDVTTLSTRRTKSQHREQGQTATGTRLRRERLLVQRETVASKPESCLVDRDAPRIPTPDETISQIQHSSSMFPEDHVVDSLATRAFEDVPLRHIGFFGKPSLRPSVLDPAQCFETELHNQARRPTTPCFEICPACSHPF